MCKYSVPIKIAVGTPPVVGGSAGSIIVGYVNKPLSVSLPNSGGPVDTCLVKAGSSLLPPGINTSAYGYTCTLSGIPVTVYNDTQGPVPPVTLHAENSFGFSDRDVTIRITHSAPKFALSAIYAHNLGSGEFTTGHDILNIGGSVVSCSVSRVSGVSIGVGQLAAVELNGSCLLFGDVDFADNNGKPYVFSVKGTNKIGSDTIKVTVSP